MFISGDIIAQNLSNNKGSEGVLEYILNAQENAMLLEGISVDDIVDKLNNPINLNTADEKELRELFILSPYQIQALLKYRAKVGVIESIYELQLIKGLDRITLERLIPFVDIQKIDIVGTEDFLISIQCLLEEYINIKPSKLNRRFKEKEDNIRCLQISGSRQINRFKTFIYEDSTIKLERKYKKFGDKITLRACGE